MYKLLAFSMLATIAVLSVQETYAGVILDFTPATQSLIPSDTVEFSGTLTNTGVANVFLNGDVSILAYTGLSLDDSPFFINAPLFLVPGQSYVGPFFDVTAAASALSGSYSGSYTIQGGSDANTFDDLASQDFTLNVGSGVPEPNYCMPCALTLTVIVALPFILSKRQKINRTPI
jgi:hypothetical protein